jgi:kynureninase
MDATDRAAAELLDAQDPLAGFRDRFVVAEPDLIYLDGNSLGRLGHAARQRLAEAVTEEWGRGLVRSWPEWMRRPAQVGDLLAEHLLGARPGEVLVADSTTVNLYKLAAAALDARPGRRVVVTDDDNFPTDRYVLEGLAAQRGLELRMLRTDPVEGVRADQVAEVLDERVALVSLSHVAYRSGALADMAAISALARAAGALTLWDECHAVGAVPVALDADGADLAVGCTYKYLNAGPGAPAFLYVRAELQPHLRQPIWGWFGQRDQFAMGSRYDPAPDLRRFATGSPPILGVALVEEGAKVLAEAGIGQLYAKAQALTGLLVELADRWLAPLGLTLASPRDPARRGAHVTLAHPDALRISRALIEQAGVVPDFRTPDRLRLGPAPVATRFVDVWDAMDRLRRLVHSGAHEHAPLEPSGVEPETTP